MTDDGTTAPLGWDAYGPTWTSLADERGFAVRALTPAEHHATDTLGAEHVADIDWDHCLVVDD